MNQPEVKYALNSTCGPHCGRKDRYISHCRSCHREHQLPMTQRPTHQGRTP